MKVRYIIYCALIALAVFSAPAPADCNIVIVGDANSDGRITTADSMLALRMAAGSMPPDIERADVNHDGDVNSLDALMILAMAQKAQVYVNAPETVSGAFNATIDIHNVVDLDSGQFDLSFNSSVVNVTAVCDGNIDGTTVPISWQFMGADTIRVLFDLPFDNTVTGAGSLATISFEITGSVGDNSVLDISNGELFDLDTYGDGIPATWTDCEVIIGESVMVNAPEVVSGAFNVTIDIENVTDLDSGQFDLSFNSSVVNVTAVCDGNIDGTTVPISWQFMGADTIRVLFDLPFDNTVTGAGSLATISFEITGSVGDNSVLDISNGELFDLDTYGDGIPATWTDCEVTIGVPVTVNAPKTVSGAFNATIDIGNVDGLDSGQFDLSFNSSVVNVTAVYDGNIGGTTVPVSGWSFIDADTIRVLFNCPDADAVSGSGSLATISFEITGSVGDNSVLDISNGELFDLDTYGDGIPATWTDCEVTV